MAKLAKEITALVLKELQDRGYITTEDVGCVEFDEIAMAVDVALGHAVLGIVTNKVDKDEN